MKLNERVPEFQALGVNVVAISYDDFEQNASFSSEEGLGYTLLSDQNAATVKGLGILNHEYEDGHPAFGIPHPGILFIRADATIGFKRAVSGYKERPSLDELLGAVRDATTQPT